MSTVVVHRDNGLPLERWRQAATAMRLIPERFASPTIEPLDACRLLGYDLKKTDWSTEVDWLREILPAYPDAAGPRYDYYDVANLGLAARTGRSVAEQAESMVMRFASGAAGSWRPPRRWRLTVEWTCTEPACPGGAWRVPRPLPEHVEELVEWTATTAGRVAGQTGDTVRAEDSARVTVTGEVVLRGEDGPFTDPRCATLYAETLAALTAGEPAYQWMPDALRWDVDAALATGIADCVVIGLQVCRRLAQLGLTARLRRGLLLGAVTTIEHFWAEVRDGERWRPLDPVLALLDRRANGALGTFAAQAAGARINRLLPLGQARRGPLAEHECPIGGSPAYAVAAFSPRSTIDVSP